MLGCLDFGTQLLESSKTFFGRFPVNHPSNLDPSLLGSNGRRIFFHAGLHLLLLLIGPLVVNLLRCRLLRFCFFSFRNFLFLGLLLGLFFYFFNCFFSKLFLFIFKSLCSISFSLNFLVLLLLEFFSFCSDLLLVLGTNESSDNAPSIVCSGWEFLDAQCQERYLFIVPFFILLGLCRLFGLLIFLLLFEDCFQMTFIANDDTELGDDIIDILIFRFDIFDLFY